MFYSPQEYEKRPDDVNTPEEIWEYLYEQVQYWRALCGKQNRQINEILKERNQSDSELRALKKEIVPLQEFKDKYEQFVKECENLYKQRYL